MNQSPTPPPSPAIGLAGLTGQHPAIEPAAAAVPAVAVPAVPVPMPIAPAPTYTDAVRGGADRDVAGRTEGARHPVSFTGSGSEYFRIWIVNLLLTLVTFGIYFPWAKVRKLRYFYGNTLVAGHALDFHGEPLKMLRGYAIVSVLFVAYSVAAEFSPTAGGIALLLLAAVWPALLYAGFRFRLSQTSWRGLRFAFRGTMGGAYKALLPALLPLVILVPLFALVDTPTAGTEPGTAPTTGAMVGLVFAPMLVIAGVVPLIWWSLKRYQHGGFGLGNVRTAFTAGPGPFYAVFFKTMLLTLAAAFVFGIVAALVTGAGALVSAVGGTSGRSASTWVLVVLAFVFALGYLAVLWIARPYFASRMQNLAWMRTESSAVGFDSRLRYRPLLWLGLKNWLLIILTLGLYWPFAAIATAKMKLEAVEVIAHQDLDALVRGEGDASKDATGDAAGDVFGIDIGM